MVYIIYPANKNLLEHKIQTKKEKCASKGERFKEPLGIHLTKSTAICEDGGSAYDAGHKQVNKNYIGSHGIC